MLSFVNSTKFSHFWFEIQSGQELNEFFWALPLHTHTHLSPELELWDAAACLSCGSGCHMVPWEAVFSWSSIQELWAHPCAFGSLHTCGVSALPLSGVEMLMTRCGFREGALERQFSWCLPAFALSHLLHSWPSHPARVAVSSRCGGRLSTSLCALPLGVIYSMDLTPKCSTFWAFGNTNPCLS